MDADVRREEIQRRLRDLQRERTISEKSVAQLSRVVGGVELIIKAGDRVTITDDGSIFDAAERDPLKKMYCGESGIVTLTLSDFNGVGEAVEVKFIDGCSHTYSLNCVDGFVSKPERKVLGVVSSTKSSLVNAALDAPAAPEQSLAAPSWSSLRKHTSLRSVASSKQPATDSTLTPEPSVPALESTVGSSSSLSSSIVVPPVRIEAARQELLQTHEPRASAIVPRASSSEVPKGISPAPVLTLKVTPRTVFDNDESDDLDLLKSPREDFLRTESWAQEKRYSPAIASMSPVAMMQLTSQIPPCPPAYTPKFPLGDPRSLIPRPQSESTGVKCCTLTTSEDYASCSPRTRRTRTRDVAFRSHQSTLDAMLAACTTELGWAREGRRVTRLFVAPQGQEVMYADMVRDGCHLVASDGEAFTAPLHDFPSARSAASSATLGVRSGRPTSPFSARPKLPAAAATPSGISFQKPKVVRVYINGEYGDVQGDHLPFRTVTIRPTCKTIKSVYTLLDRELQWNTLGRHVDLLYSSRGDVITTLEAIVDGESIVASSGDRFIIPRSTSILHRENQSLDEGAARRMKSPVRPRSPYH